MGTDRTQRWKRAWNKQSRRYDGQMQFWDRHLFKDSRAWVCSQASGTVLEVAVGTGLNLPYYRDGLRLIGIDFSPEMLDLARKRSAELGRDIDLREGDALHLDLADDAVDTVVCTFGLCAVSDEVQVLREMRRVLRPDGLMLLADHVRASSALGRGLQRATTQVAGARLPVKLLRATEFRARSARIRHRATGTVRTGRSGRAGRRAQARPVVGGPRGGLRQMDDVTSAPR